MTHRPSLPTQPVSIALHQAVMLCLRTKLQQACQTLGKTIPEPNINYHQRGTSAGSAHYTKWEIRLNKHLLFENGQAFIDQVIPHELAHLLVFRHYGRVAPHGKEWRWMMEHILQTPALRTHQFAVQSVQGATFHYRCQCQQHQLTVRRHNRVQRGETRYICRHCKHPLVYQTPTTA